MTLCVDHLPRCSWKVQMVASSTSSPSPPCGFSCFLQFLASCLAVTLPASMWPHAECKQPRMNRPRLPDQQIYARTGRAAVFLPPFLTLFGPPESISAVPAQTSGSPGCFSMSHHPPPPLSNLKKLVWRRCEEASMMFSILEGPCHPKPPCLCPDNSELKWPQHLRPTVTSSLTAAVCPENQIGPLWCHKGHWHSNFVAKQLPSPVTSVACQRWTQLIKVNL